MKFWGEISDKLIRLKNEYRKENPKVKEEDTMYFTIFNLIKTQLQIEEMLKYSGKVEITRPNTRDEE